MCGCFESEVMFINSFISWIGGKKALRNVIYRLFPKDYGRYIEVFGGGGWVLFVKSRIKRNGGLQTIST
jgi:site-specific DNA-adenine methylase